MRFKMFSRAMFTPAILSALALNASLMGAAAANLTLAWDRSAATNIVAYTVYSGASSGVYTTNLAVGTNTNVTLTGLAQGATGYVAVTAMDATGLKSVYSSEVKYTIPSTPPSIVLSAPTNGAIYAAPAMIKLTATVVANSHTLNKVQFLNGTNLLAESTAAPYAFTWTNTAPGSYTVNARLVYDSTATLTASPSAITVTGLPAPWQTADIGAVNMPGSASSSSGIFTIKGSGKISGNADTFRFVYQPMTGNGDIRAQVRSVQNSGTAGDTGVMIRESLTTGSRYVLAGIDANGTYQWQRRRSTSGSTTTSNSIAGPLTNAWVRLVRTGNTNTCYRSADGMNWTQMGAVSVTMATNVYFGLVVASGQTNTVNTSTLGNVIAIP